MSHGVARTGLAAVAVVVLAFGTVSAVSLLATETRVVRMDEPGITRAQVDVGGGSVRVDGDPEGTRAVLDHRVTWHLRSPRIEDIRVGDTLRVRSRCGWSVGRSCSSRVGLRVPAAAGVSVRSEGGSVEVAGVAGPTTVRVDADEVSLRDLRGPVTVRAGAGAVTGTGLRGGRADVRVAVGAVRLSYEAAPQNVMVDVDVGEVVVLVPRDGRPWRVTADTDVGDRTVEVATDRSAARTINVRSSVGAVRVAYGS